MAMMPARVKYRKMHRGSRTGLAHSGNTVAFGEFGSRVRPFLKIIDAAEPEKRILSVAWERRDPVITNDVLPTLSAYIVAVKGGYYGQAWNGWSLPVRGPNPLLSCGMP